MVHIGRPWLVQSDRPHVVHIGRTPLVHITRPSLVQYSPAGDSRYSRNLVLMQGLIRGLLVPRLQCCECGRSVDTRFATIEKYRRYWYDLTETALLEYGLSTSLRRIAAKLSGVLGGVSLYTLTSRIHDIEAGILAWKRRRIEDVPDVVQLDGIWFSSMRATGAKRRDKAGRLRKKKHKADRVVLVAVGIWTKTGRKEILDWQIAGAESEKAWLVLLDRLMKRGLSAQRGLKLVVHDGGGGVTSALSYGFYDVAEQRCIFHKLQNVSDNFESKGGGSVREITKDAAHVFAGTSKHAVRMRLHYFKKKWQDKQAKSVKSLLSDFEKTLAYFDVGIDAVQYARTTSIQERANRELRRKFDQMGIVQSKQGEQSAVHLAVLAYNCWTLRDDWSHVITQLIHASLATFTNQ